MNHINRRKAATLFVVAALFASVLSIPTIQAYDATPASVSAGKIVFDYSHGQEPGFSGVQDLDASLDGNLTLMGYDVVWARGGINATVLSGAVAFIAGAIYGAGNGYLAAEVTAISEWFNSGDKFMWIGYDSDYTSAPDAGQWNNDNMTMILEAVGSHIYGEPSAIEDPVSNCASAYRAVANTTLDNPDLIVFADGVSNVLMHGPTLLYGADGDSTTNPVALETTDVDDVYPILMYGANATIVESDLTDPLAHSIGDEGNFVAVALENNAGADESGILVVSGASPYGGYQPMYSSEYKNVTLDGYNLVLNAIEFGVLAALSDPGEGKIVFDYSHGQAPGYSGVQRLDGILRATLFLKGYTTYWAYGGINSTILADAVGFIAGAIYGAGNNYLAAEVTAIADWFNEGRKFMWIGYDSDYTSAPDAGQWNNDNMTMILEAVGSNIYGEPSAIEDPVSNCASAYRAVANTTSADAYVAAIGVGVSNVLLHGPTLIYSANGTATTDPVALETTDVDDVYPILMYGANATIVDSDTTDPLAHSIGDEGNFVAVALEMTAGDNETGSLVVSGASPYGGYQPMFSDIYKNVTLDGYNFVLNTIDFGIANIPPLPEPTTETNVTTTTDDGGGGFTFDTTTLILIGAGAVVVIIIIVIVVKKR